MFEDIKEMPLTMKYVSEFQIKTSYDKIEKFLFPIKKMVYVEKNNFRIYINDKVFLIQVIMILLSLK